METYRSNEVRRWALSLHRKHGSFEFTAPALLFAGLVLSLTAPLYLWDILGI